MTEQDYQQPNNTFENYDIPNIVGDIDTIEEETEYLEKKIKIPVWIWVFLIITVSVIALMVTANQSPTLIP